MLISKTQKLRANRICIHLPLSKLYIRVVVKLTTLLVRVIFKDKMDNDIELWNDIIIQLGN